MLDINCFDDRGLQLLREDRHRGGAQSFGQLGRGGLDIRDEFQRAIHRLPSAGRKQRACFRERSKWHVAKGCNTGQWNRSSQHEDAEQEHRGKHGRAAGSMRTRQRAARGRKTLIG